MSTVRAFRQADSGVPHQRPPAAIMRSVPRDSTLRSPQFVAVIGMVLFIMFGFGLIVPILPLFAEHFGVGAAAVGLVFTVFAFTRLVGDFAVGTLIDRYGERMVAAVGALIVGLSSTAAGAARTFTQLVVFRGLGGFGSAFFLGAVTAYLLGTAEPEVRGRAMSIFQASVGVGITLGPLVGGILGANSLRRPLYAYGLVAVVTAPICLAVIRKVRVTSAEASGSGELCAEGPPPARRHFPALSKLRPLLKDSAYRAALMASATNFWISQGLFVLVSLVWVNTIRETKGSVGVPLTVFGVASLLVIWHAGSVSDRRGRKAALVPALAGSAVTMFLLGFAHARWDFLAWMVLLGVGSGYLYPGPTSIVADVATEEQRAVAVGGYRMAADVGALIGPAVAGIVAQAVSYTWAFVALAAFILLSFLTAVVARETLPSRVAARSEAASAQV